MGTLEELIASRSAPAPPPRPVTLPSALDLLTQLTGKSLEQINAEVAAVEALPSGASYETVKDTPELRRVFALPRRTVDFDTPEVHDLANRITAAFAKPYTPYCIKPDGTDNPRQCNACQGKGQMRLKPIQALALAEIFHIGGMVGPIRVGGGKTLISYLAPVMFPVPQARPLLVIPAGLRKKTGDSFRELYRHWKGPDPNTYRIESYEILGQVKAGEKLGPKGEKLGLSLLGTYQPTIIVLDEAHKAKNPKAAVTARLLRYLHANPTVSLVILSGTLFRRSLKDFGPLTLRALGKLAPLPDSRIELETWAGAIDEKVSSLRRVQPGPLMELCRPEEQTLEDPELRLAAVRSAYGRRFYQTPGVIASAEKELSTSLIFRELRIDNPDPVLDAHFETFRGTWVTPQGIDVPDGKEFKRHALEMALGFEYHWDPQPPEDWLTIRRLWYRLVRQVLKNNRRHIDSEKQARDAILAGLYPGKEVYTEWKKVEPTFTPNTVSAWFSTEVLRFAATWAENNKGVVWAAHTGFANALAKVTGLKYYGRQGKTLAGEYIMDAPKGYPCIASVASNKLGRDLQHHWATNLIVSPEGDGLTWEQLAARTHRDGQPEEEVSIDWLSNCTEHLANWAQALKDSDAQERVTGQPQKLQYGDKVLQPPPDLSRGRWGNKGIPDDTNSGTTAQTSTHLG